MAHPMLSGFGYASTVGVAAAAYPMLVLLGLSVPSILWIIGLVALGTVHAGLLGMLVASTAAIRSRDLAERTGLPRIPLTIRRSMLATSTLAALVLAGAMSLAATWCNDALTGSSVFFLLPTPIMLGAELWRMHREANSPAGRRKREQLQQIYTYLDVNTLIGSTTEFIGSSQLGAAAIAGDDQTVRDLLAAGAALDQPCQLGFTALMLAIIHKCETTALLLIESGADVGKASAIGSTPLMAATQTGSTTIVEALLAKGAAVDAPQKVLDMSSGYTALMLAAMAGDVDVLRILLAHGADPTKVDSSGHSVIELARKNARMEILALLLRAAGSVITTTGLDNASEKDSDTTTVDQLTADDATKMELRLTRMTPEERTAGLITGILQGGLPFANTVSHLADLAGNRGVLQQHADECRSLMIQWLMGAHLTNRTDEDERRLLLCMSFIGQVKLFDRKSVSLLHMAANCILKLPKRHPRRDVTLAMRLLLDMANWCDANKEAELLVTASDDFLRLLPTTEDLATLDGILALAKRAEDALRDVQDLSVHHSFRSAFGFYLISLAMAARDTKQPEAQSQWTAKAAAQLEQLVALHPTNADEIADLRMMEGVIGEMRNDAAAAAGAYASIRDLGRSEGKATAYPALHEGRLRLKLRDYKAVVDVLEPTLAVFKESYLLAVETSEARSAGCDFSNAVSYLAFAQAKLGDWDAAIRTVDQAKSLRLRHRAAMRASPEGQRLLELEASLYALSRGLTPGGLSYKGSDVPDLLRKDVSREALFREEYRRARPQLASNIIDSPSTVAIAAELHGDEAAVLLGTNFAGTFIAVIFADDRDEPGAHLILDDWPSHKLWELVGKPKTGWMWVLAAPQGYKGLDYRQALARLIEDMDGAIAAPLAALLRGRGVSRLTMVMSSWLHLTPWWVMPSLAGYRIAVAPSAAQLVLTRNKRAVSCKALGAADPTLDLPLSIAEVEAMAHHLSACGFETTVCSRHQVTEEAILPLTTDAGIFHFSGHGRSDFFAPTRSALLFYPNLRPFDRFGSDPLACLAAQINKWDVSAFEGRFADLPGIGRLYETGFPDARALERFLEYGERGTLWARYEGGQMAQMAELCRTGDILVANGMNRCGLAFLSACESGGAGIDPDVDEPLGLPSALHLAGVSTVIATLWPVTDVVAALFADLFYAWLARSTGVIDLTAVVTEVADRLRRMTREEAATLLDALGRRTKDSKAKFRLKAAARLVLASAETHPYSDPIAWASFFISGSGDFHLGEDGDDGHMAVSQKHGA